MHVLTIIFLVFAAVGIGYLCGRFRRPDLSAANQINIAVLLPALVLSVLSGKDFNGHEFGPLAPAALDDDIADVREIARAADTETEPYQRRNFVPRKHG